MHGNPGCCRPYPANIASDDREPVQVHRGVYDAAQILYERFLPLVTEHLKRSGSSKIVFTVSRPPLPPPRPLSSLKFPWGMSWGLGCSSRIQSH